MFNEYFQLTSSGKINLLSTEFSASLGELIDDYLTKSCSYPAFLSAVTMDLFKRQTIIQHSEPQPSTSRGFPRYGSQEPSTSGIQRQRSEDEKEGSLSEGSEDAGLRDEDDDENERRMREEDEEDERRMREEEESDDDEEDIRDLDTEDEEERQYLMSRRRPDSEDEEDDSGSEGRVYDEDEMDDEYDELEEHEHQQRNQHQQRQLPPPEPQRGPKNPLEDDDDLICLD